MCRRILQYVLFLALIFSAFIGQSQTNKGTFTLSPSAGYTLNSQVFDDTSGTYLYHGIEGGMSVGYFFTESFKVDLSVNVFNYEYRNDDHFTAPGVFIGASFGYTKALTDKIRIPVSLGFGYSQFNSNDTFETYMYRGYAADGHIGFEYLLRQNLGIEIRQCGQVGKLQTEYQDVNYTLKYYNYSTKIAINIYL